MSYRLEKFASTLQQALGEILIRESLNPEFKRIGIVRVGLSRDLERATIYVSCPSECADSVFTQLRRASGFIKKRLGEKMRLRTMPALDFKPDTALELENKLERLANPETDHEETNR